MKIDEIWSKWKYFIKNSNLNSSKFCMKIFHNHLRIIFNILTFKCRHFNKFHIFPPSTEFASIKFSFKHHFLFTRTTFISPPNILNYYLIIKISNLRKKLSGNKKKKNLQEEEIFMLIFLSHSFNLHLIFAAFYFLHAYLISTTIVLLNFLVFFLQKIKPLSFILYFFSFLSLFFYFLQKKKFYFYFLWKNLNDIN